MRTTTGDTISKLTQQYASEPVLVVKIWWTGTPTYYSTRAFTIGATPVQGRIVKVGTASNQSKQGRNVNSVGTVAFTFDDTDGAIRTLIESQAAELTFAAVYVHYPDLTGADGFCLISGRLVGPFNWREGDRTFDFEIETYISTTDISYSLQEGDFTDGNAEVYNVPWPIVFGKPAHVRSVRIRKQTEGQLAAPISLFNVLFNNPWNSFCLGTTNTVKSYTYDDTGTSVVVDDKIAVRGGSHFPQGTEIKIIIVDCIFKGSFTGDVFTVTESNCAKYTDVALGGRVAGPDQKNPKVAWLDEFKPLLGHWVWFGSGFFDTNGYEYGCEVRIVKQDNLKIWFDRPVMKYNPVNGYVTRFLTPSDTLPEVRAISRYGLLVSISEFYDTTIQAMNNAFRPHPASKLPKAVKVSAEMIQMAGGGFWNQPIDTSVRLFNIPDPDIYLGSILPANAITGVFSRRKVNGVYRFCPIPKNYYEKHLSYTIATPSGTYDTTCLFFYKPLKDYQDEEWSDEVYITLESTVGPNTADILKWLCEEYTNMVVDITAYNATKTILADAPSHFALYNQRNALEVMTEIAWQARSALIVETGTCVMRVLNAPQTIFMTLDASQIVEKSVEFGFTPLEDLETKIQVTWVPDYLDGTKQRIVVYRNNFAAFGEKSSKHEFYIYNNGKYIDWALQYWGNILSNSWRKVICKAGIETLRLQPYDVITIDLTNFSGVLGVSYALVENISFNLETYEVELTLWTPYKAGTSVADLSVWSYIHVVP